MDAIDAVYESVKDMKSYRRPLADLIFESWGTALPNQAMDDDGSVIFKVFSDEVVLRIVEKEEGEGEDARTHEVCSSPFCD